MGCRCQERAAALLRVVKAGASGDVRGLARDVGFVGRTLHQDFRSGDLARAAKQQLSLLRFNRARRS